MKSEKNKSHQLWKNLSMGKQRIRRRKNNVDKFAAVTKFTTQWTQIKNSIWKMRRKLKIENRKKEPMLCVQIKNIQNLINCMCKFYFLFLKILKQKENKESCIICFEVMISRKRKYNFLMERSNLMTTTGLLLKVLKFRNSVVENM